VENFPVLLFAEETGWSLFSACLFSCISQNIAPHLDPRNLLEGKRRWNDACWSASLLSYLHVNGFSKWQTPHQSDLRNKIQHACIHQVSS